MNEGLMKVVNWVRLGIYVIGFVAVIFMMICTLTGCRRCPFELGDIEFTTHHVAFWPPDMVPHPHLPEPEKKDDMA